MFRSFFCALVLIACLGCNKDEQNQTIDAPREEVAPKSEWSWFVADLVVPTAHEYSWIHPDETAANTVDHDGDCYCAHATTCHGSVNPTCEVVLPGDCDDRTWDCPRSAHDYTPRTRVCWSGAGTYEELCDAELPCDGRLLYIAGPSRYTHPNNGRADSDGADLNCDGVNEASLRWQGVIDNYRDRERYCILSAAGDCDDTD